jgi:hypothetical protein
MGAKNSWTILSIPKIKTQVHMYRCVQTNNKSQWCYLGGYKNYRFPMDIARHDFNLGGQLCEQPPKLYLEWICPSVLKMVLEGSNRWATLHELVNG